jgi:hypothetical protein
VSSVVISLIAFSFVFGGSLLGMALRTAMPANHLSAESQNIVKVGMGLVGTMAALVLGLLVASAKGSYDVQSSEVTQVSSSVVVLDRVLAHYGPETKEARETLRGIVALALDRMWPKDKRESSQLEPRSFAGELLYDELQMLSPKNDDQRSFRSQALSMALRLGQTRWLMYEQGASSVSMPLVIMMVFWLTIVFLSWGLFAPCNGTVIATFCVAALSVSGAILLIPEMYSPYEGMIQISSAPLRVALAHLGQ